MRRATAGMLLGSLFLVLASSLCAEPKISLPTSDRTVFLLGDMPREERLAWTTAVMTSGQPGPILFYSDESAPYIKAFLDAYDPRLVLRTGKFTTAPDNRLDRRTALFESSTRLFTRAKQVVLAPVQSALLLQAASLANVLRAPLIVHAGKPGDKDKLESNLRDWETDEVYAVGDTDALVPAGYRVHRLATERHVTDFVLGQRLQRGSIKTLVVANPHDAGRGNMSILAPWIASRKDALLLLTNPAGTNVRQVVDRALRHPGVRHADNVILVGSLSAIPVEKRPNPIEGKDRFIEMEPLTPFGKEPFSFAVGRIFHEDPAVVALMLARTKLLAKAAPRALVVGNPGGGLPLLEMFSRTTAQELTNNGFEVASFFGEKAEQAELRKLLPEQTIFLWEGHHSTLVKHYEAHAWPEPMKPSLVFLQSCLSLVEPEAQPFLRRGAVAVIGSSTRTYSATGGALSLAYFDSLLYEKRSLGDALRQAKNFLLAFSLLKEKRLGPSELAGANLRSAWAFSLWGDPTEHLPLPMLPDDALPGVRHRVKGNTIVLTVPAESQEKVDTIKYRAKVEPNVRLAGLLSRKDDQDGAALVPLLFAEIELPHAPPGMTPVLHSRLPEHNWVFCWDARQSRGSLLVRRRAQDKAELRFTIEWQEEMNAAHSSR